MQRTRRVFGIMLVAGLVLASAHAQEDGAKDSTGLPGDHFSLQGALEMFQKAASPEEFEKLLNEQANHVNNLDLNGDGDVDYVRVAGAMKGDVHTYVLQVPVSGTESQDIAVIELEKSGAENAIVQIVGDADVFGEQTVLEPKGAGDDEGEEDVESIEDGRGPSAAAAPAVMLMPRIVVNVWPWPIVRFVYAPGYRVWVSPWRWRSYPAWWRPWRPLAWRVFHPFRIRPHASVVVTRHHRVVRAHGLYVPGRVTSVTVHKRHGAAVDRYRVTRTKTVRTKDGVKRTRTTTRVRTRR
jgi:hypothetical protein